MTTERFLLGRGRERLSADDLAAVEAAVTGVHDVQPRAVLSRRGEPVHSSTLLVDGFICRYMDDREGRRQLVAIHVPGDFVDLHGFTMQVLDHDIITIGSARVATVSHEALARIIETRPRLTRMLWFSTLLDAAMHREWIFRLGRLSADGRVAHLFCEIEARLEMVGLSRDGRFMLPLTQSDLGEACGLTGVHVNRTLRALREEGLMTFANGRVEILDRARLTRLAEFEAMYLYGGNGWSPRID